jgi:hypothetical protein
MALKVKFASGSSARTGAADEWYYILVRLLVDAFEFLLDLNWHSLQLNVTSARFKPHRSTLLPIG